MKALHLERFSSETPTLIYYCIESDSVFGRGIEQNFYKNSIHLEVSTLQKHTLTHYYIQIICF